MAKKKFIDRDIIIGRVVAVSTSPYPYIKVQNETDEWPMTGQQVVMVPKDFWDEITKCVEQGRFPNEFNDLLKAFKK